MKQVVVGIILIAIHFSALSAFAEPGKRESVKELLELMNVDSMVDTMYSQMSQLSGSMGKQMGVKASEQGIFDEYMEEISASMKEEISWKQMEAPIIDIYLNNYTEKEIQDMLTFYRSETGRSLIQKMPKVMGDSVMVSQNMLQQYIPKMRKIAEQFQEKLQAHRESAAKSH